MSACPTCEGSGRKHRVTVAYYHPSWHPEEWKSIVNAARLGGDKSQPRAVRLAEARYLRYMADAAIKARAAEAANKGSAP